LKAPDGLRHRILMIFVDGVGLGASDSAANPLAAARPGFLKLSGGALWTNEAEAFQDATSFFRGVDACLGMEGLPQSGTGQASLFTGVNCVEMAGRHYGPYPHSATREVLRADSIFARLGPERATFANSFPPRFFEWTRKSDRWPVITRACLDAQIRIRTLSDLQTGSGLAADITGSGLAKGTNHRVDPVTPVQAADNLLGMASRFDFTLFEIFHTDKAGHAQDRKAAEQILDPLDGLLAALAERKPAPVSLVVCSDHGNLEDLGVKTHTRNPVPLAVLGPAAPCFAEARDLTGVVPAIMAALS
jgi:2,3-bisphosphoglycerate-independent phosphoglycerate mutase